MDADSHPTPPAAADADGLVWHYTDGQGLASILRNNVLWATASPFLNDAGEVTLGASMLKRELHRRAEFEPVYREFLPLLDREPPEPGVADHGPSPGTFFILSAARDRDLLAMWRLYGGHGESYAIGLDAQTPLAALADEAPENSDWLIQNRRWRPVRYEDAEQQALIDAVFDDLPEEVQLFRRHQDAGAYPQQALQQLDHLRDDMEAALMLIKHLGFIDERETRYCVGVHPTPRQDVPAGLVSHRPTRYGMAPYLRLTGAGDTGAAVTTTTGALPIRALAISPSPNGVASQTSLAGLATTCGYPDLPVIRSQIPFRE